MAISERDVLLLYCIKICLAIVCGGGVNITLHTNIHAYNHLFYGVLDLVIVVHMYI